MERQLDLLQQEPLMRPLPARQKPVEEQLDMVEWIEAKALAEQRARD